jgi:hypothetical protein
VRWKFNGDYVEEGGSRGFSFEGTNLHIASFKHKRKGESNEVQITEMLKVALSIKTLIVNPLFYPVSSLFP